MTTRCVYRQGVNQLALVLKDEPEDHIRAAVAWSLGQIGRHTPEHAKAVALANVFPRLLQLYLSTNSSEDLQLKVRAIFLFSSYGKTVISFSRRCDERMFMPFHSAA